MSISPVPPEPVPANVLRKYRFYAVALSALIYPGAGQFLQRRWLAALAFAGVFTAPFAAFSYYAFHIIWGYYRMAFSQAWMEESAPAEPLPLVRMGVAFAACVIIYLWNLVDAGLGARKKPPA